METVIIVIHLMVVIALVVVVLLQRSEGGALGIGGGGGGGGLFSSRGTANVLTRATAILAATFFATSIVLTILARQGTAPTSILDTPTATTEEAPASDTTPAAPPSGSGQGVLDQLQPPSQPSGPQVPSSQ